MNRYIISDEAIQDLQDISDYFLINNLEAGEQFFQLIPVEFTNYIIYNSDVATGYYRI
jgi:plasmid stabilization system protein ParE